MFNQGNQRLLKLSSAKLKKNVFVTRKIHTAISQLHVCNSYVHSGNLTVDRSVS